MKELANKAVNTQSFAARVFGCWHKRMSRPITKKNTTYRYCVKCGLRRNYDLKNSEYTGAFYAPAIAEDLHFV